MGNLPTMCLTQAQTIDYLEKVEGVCRFIGVTYSNEVRMNKTGNPYYGQMTKKVSVEVHFNSDYENRVNNKLEKEGLDRDFKSEGLRGMDWKVYNKTLVNKKGEFLVRFYEVSGKYPHTEYFLNGQPMEASEIEKAKQFFQKSGSSRKQAESGLSEEEQVRPRNIKIANIQEIRFNNRIIKID